MSWHAILSQIGNLETDIGVINWRIRNLNIRAALGYFSSAALAVAPPLARKKINRATASRGWTRLSAGWGASRSEEEASMVRNILIGLAALAAVTATPSVGESARGMGMGHGGIGMGMGHVGMSHATFAPSAGFVGGPRNFGGSRSFAFAGSHVAFNHLHHAPFRHHFHNRFIFAAGFAYPYAYDDGCWVRVWTPWGWRWRSVCY
jgi:hypothetical protein